MKSLANIPLSLYIHFPWCVQKCPYCDFNSHTLKQGVPELSYIKTLIEDFKNDLSLVGNRPITSIFMGGGTPSLFSGDAMKKLLDAIYHTANIDPNVEITLEANPGTIDIKNFMAYRNAGINRLSLGIQSFNTKHLKDLGRIHSAKEATRAINIAREVGFENINLDLMFGLPEQTIAEGLKDLQTALSFKPAHISWYQLTLEPNTVFYKYPPPLPLDDEIATLQYEGQSLLADNHFAQYEISAYAKKQHQCKHNLNYWEFGDYLGIGAGAHGKITCHAPFRILRRQKYKLPRAYLKNIFDLNQDQRLTTPDIIFEFMLNALRLNKPIPFTLFTDRTGLSIDRLSSYLVTAQEKSFVTYDDKQLLITPLGRQYLNNLLELFLPVTR